MTDPEFRKTWEEHPLVVPAVQWFPGHMAKTRRLMSQSKRLVDVVVEMLDARIPFSSQNPEIDDLLSGKPRVVILNKSDYADPDVTAKWLRFFSSTGVTAIAADCRSGKGLNRFMPVVRETLRPLLERRATKGMDGQPVRMMIVGIPNVGKSSLINRLAGEKRAKAEDRPGVTRGRQWVSLKDGIELLDMPGVLWPKFEDPAVGERLAFTGAVKDDVVDLELLAMRLLWQLRETYPQALLHRFRITAEEMGALDGPSLLEMVARKRGMLLPGGESNTERASITVLDEFRGGKLGRITLERPSNEKQDVESPC